VAFEPRACINGGALVALDEACLPMTDEGVTRGYGAVETIAAWGGKPFRVAEHLDRLARSLEAIMLPEPDRPALERDIARALDGVENDALVRLYVTGSGTRVVVASTLPDRPAPRHLVPYVAPWIQPQHVAMSGAKTMSYLPNMLATRTAHRAGGDDALLLSLHGAVLEGPTFAICWVARDVICAPTTELGIIDSVSRQVVLELARDAGRRVVEGVYGLEDLGQADEVMLCSTGRDLISFELIVDHVFSGPTPVRDALSKGLWAVRRA
jgi:branched-chain amino acid aminotransferase